MAWQPDHDDRANTPTGNSDDDTHTPLETINRPAQYASAIGSAQNHRVRPRQPSPEDSDTATDGRPPKRRRAAPPVNGARTGSDSPPFVSNHTPQIAPSPLQIHLSGGSGSSQPPRQRYRPPTPGPASSSAELWRARSPPSSQPGLWSGGSSHSSQPLSGSRSGTRARPIEIEIDDDDDDDSIVILGSSPTVLEDDDDDDDHYDDDVVLVGRTVPIVRGVVDAAPSAPAAGRSTASGQPSSGVSYSEIAASFTAYITEAEMIADADRQAQINRQQRVEARQQQRRDLLQRQHQQSLQQQQQAQQEDTYDGPPTLKRLTCVICMDVPTNLTAAACGHVFCHTCLMEALIASENRQRAAYEPKCSTCPVCRKKISRAKDKDVVPLVILKRPAV